MLAEPLSLVVLTSRSGTSLVTDTSPLANLYITTSLSSVHYYIMMDFATDYQLKLNALTVLKQALEGNLITLEQYTLKQQEFLSVVDFRPALGQDTNHQVALVVQRMERDLERARARGMREGEQRAFIIPFRLVLVRVIQEVFGSI